MNTPRGILYGFISLALLVAIIFATIGDPIATQAQLAGDLPSTGTLDDAVMRIQNRGLEVGTAVAKAEAELAKVGQQIDALQKYGARLELHLIALRSAKAAFTEAESAVRDEATTLTVVLTPTPTPTPIPVE